MKLRIVIIVLICTGRLSYGQNISEIFFDEFSISVNRTNIGNDSHGSKNGIGFAAYHSFFANRKANLIFGIEYNRTNQFIKSMYEGQFAYSSDLTYNLNSISFPLGLRYSIGRKTKIFMEAGGFADLLINSKRKGTMHTSHLDANNQYVSEEFRFEEKTDLNNSVGLNLALGLRLSFQKYELIIKPEYKYGINKLYSDMDEIFNRYARLSVGIKIND